MRRAAAMVLGILPATHGIAQAPRPERLEGCVDAVIVAAETYDFDAGPGGRGASFDWVDCASARVVYALGGATYSIGETRWSVARGTLSMQARDNLWLTADMSGGSGDNPASAFDYFTVREGLTWKAFERAYAKLEHQYLRVAADHGNVYKLAAVVQPLPPLLLELGAARSAGGNLGTRSWTGRVDWVDARVRAYAGYSRGLTTPQVVDLVAGTRLPDTRTRQAFAGAFVPIGSFEIGLAFDQLRTPSSRRRTVGVSVRWVVS